MNFFIFFLILVFFLNFSFLKFFKLKFWIFKIFKIFFILTFKILIFSFSFFYKKQKNVINGQVFSKNLGINLTPCCLCSWNGPDVKQGQQFIYRSPLEGEWHFTYYSSAHQQLPHYFTAFNYDIHSSCDSTAMFIHFTEITSLVMRKTFGRIETDCHPFWGREIGNFL